MPKVEVAAIPEQNSCGYPAPFHEIAKGRFRKRLEARGLDDPDLWSRLHSPVGLEIGAETPEEIAVAIVGELIATRRGCASPR